MPSFVEAMTGFMRSNFCSALDTLGDAITLGNRISVGGIGQVNLANALGALVCDKPPDNVQPPPPPFTGGQCNAVYVVAATRTTNLSGTGNITVRARGPIGGVRLRQISGNNYDWELFCSNLNTSFSNCGTLADGSPAWRRLGGVQSSDGNQTTSITSVTPCGLNNCGDPAPVYPTPAPTYPFTGPVTYNIDDSTEITVPVTAVFSPIFVSIDGSLRIPVDIDVDGIDFNGELTIAPEFTLNLRPKGITSGPGKPDDPTLGPGQPGVPVPEEDEDFVPIIGVLVFSTLQSNVQRATGFPSVGGPTFLVPRIGSVQFAIRTGNSIGWTSDIDVKNLECYVPCPAPQGAIAVRVTPETGVTRTFTPIRGKPLTSF